MSRVLIVNADDFGRTAGINRGVALSHERGIVTSASLMVRHEASVAAAEYAVAHPSLGLGLHVDFGEWVRRGDQWASIYEVSVDAEEVERQLDRFRTLTGSDPTHLDSHQHAHRAEPPRTILLKLADRLGVPLRDFSQAVRYVGSFYGHDAEGNPSPAAITVPSLIAIVRALTPGVTELGCHPGYVDGADSSYASERAIEVVTLCDPRVRAALEKESIQLCSFQDALR
jgi:chitin disaccharide deacetylase